MLQPALSSHVALCRCGRSLLLRPHWRAHRHQRTRQRRLPEPGPWLHGRWAWLMAAAVRELPQCLKSKLPAKSWQLQVRIGVCVMLIRRLVCGSGYLIWSLACECRSSCHQIPSMGWLSPHWPYCWHQLKSDRCPECHAYHDCPEYHDRHDDCRACHACCG